MNVLVVPFHAGAIVHLPFVSHIMHWLAAHPLSFFMAGISAFSAAPDIVSSSDEYARRVRGAVGAWQLRVQNTALLKLLGSGHNVPVLDVGGGHGQYAAELIAHGCQLTVLGSAPETSRRIQAQVSAGKCRFETGDFMRLPFPDRAFDVVISTRQMAHVDDPPAFLGELCRVARRAVVIDFPPQRSFNIFNRLLFPLKQKLENGSTRPYTVFPEADIERMLLEQGFHVTSRAPLFCTPMVLHRVVRWVGLIRLVEWGCRLLGLTRCMGSPILLRADRQEADAVAGQAT